MMIPAFATVLDPLHTVLAQAAPKAPDQGAWIAIVVGIVLGIAVAALSFMGSKRSHRD